MTANKTKWSYLSGIIDGEGSIGVFKSEGTWFAERRQEKVPCTYYWTQIQIANTDLRLMKWLVANFGGVYYAKPQVRPTWKIGYYWKPKGRKNQETLLLGVLPYLLLKREQAKASLEFIRLNVKRNPEKREELHQLCTKLNQKGVSPTINTFDAEEASAKIESELQGDLESEQSVTAVS